MTAELIPPARTPRRAFLVWGIGVGVYVLAVCHRTSLGVAGPTAAARLNLTAGQLASFVTLQLGLYALMQIPTGILVDRFGPRRMLLTATVTMGCAQLLFAFATNYPMGLAARGLLGLGDAMTYVSVLRLAAGWFPARRYPMITAATGILGTVGNLVSTIPLAAALAQFGWVPVFAVLASLSLGYALLLLRPAAAAPFQVLGQAAASSQVSGMAVLTQVRRAWRTPAGRLGFWIHLTTSIAPLVFGTLWGYPYLTQSLGLSGTQAATLMLVLVLAGVPVTLALATVVTKWPWVRTPVSACVSLACVVACLLLTLLPRPSIAVLILVLCIFATGGPASSVGFLLARDFNPRHRISTATGMVNVGGFVGGVVAILGFGLIVDLVDGSAEHHSVTAFRWAFAFVALVVSVGLWRLMVWWLRARAEVLMASARGEHVPFELRPHRFELVDEAILAAAAHAARQQQTMAEIAELEGLEVDELMPEEEG